MLARHFGLEVWKSKSSSSRDAMYSLRKRSTALSDPKVGLLNLATEKAAEFARTDAAWLSRLFESVTVSDSDAPRCDVLFLYADMAPSGVIDGSALGLREIVRDSGAKIVVVASENLAESYIKAGAQRPYGRANLVMTLDRCGDAFERFFEALFSKMQRGESMPDAWVQLNPQVREPNFESPETIFACELGRLTFA
jgi:hypothetical protein